jgi:hypothetical protein
MDGPETAIQSNAGQPATPPASSGLDRWKKEHVFLFRLLSCLLIGLLAVGMAWLFRPVPATVKFGGPWKDYAGSGFQVSLPKRYVGGLGSSGAGAAIAEKAYTSPFYREIAQPQLADLPEEAMLWAIAPIECCQSWGEMARNFLRETDTDPQPEHDAVTEVSILKFPADEEESLAQFRDSLADPAIKTQDEQNVALAGHQAIRLVEDLEDSRYLTYLVGDGAAFWVLDFSADRDKFSAFVPLFERSAHSFRLPAPR